MKIFLGVFLSVTGILLFLHFKYKRTIDVGVSAISQLDDISEKYNKTPKQVTKGSSIYVPFIVKEIPDYNSQ